MTATRRFFLCLIVLVVVSPLASFAAPVKAKIVANTVPANPNAAAAPGASTSVAKKKSAPKLKCDDNKEGPCVCGGTAGGSVSLRKSSISTTCDKVAKAFIFVNPGDTTTSNTGDTKFITGAEVEKTKATRSAQRQPLNCDHIVELQFVQEEIDNIEKTDAPRHGVMCKQIQSNDFQSKFFDVINSVDNVVFAEAKVNNAKLIPVGNKKPKTVTAQAARGAVLYITQLLKPGSGEPSSDSIANKIETAMTNLMAGTGQSGFDQGFATRWEQRLKDSIDALNAAPKLVALRSATTSTSSATTTNCNGNGKRPASPASGTPAKKQKVRALVEFVENIARRVIGKAKPKASTKVTADSCPLPIASSAKASSKTAAKAAATGKVAATSSKTSGKAIPKTAATGKSTSKTAAKAVTKTSGKATAKATTKPSTKATNKPVNKVTAKPQSKIAATKPSSKATVKAIPVKTTEPTAKKETIVNPTTKATAKPKAKASITAKPATKAAIKTKPKVKVVKPAPKKTAKVATTKKASAKPKPKVVKPKPKAIVKAKGKSKKP